MEINTVIYKAGGCVSAQIYSDQYKNSQWFLPKMWIKWHGKERKIKLKTFLGDVIHVTESDLRKMNLKMFKIKYGKKYRKVMIYNKPRRQANRIPLLAISKKLQKKIGRLSINVEQEYEKRERNYPSWRGSKTT